MSDARRRELEREDDPQAEVAALIARLRSGELTPTRLRVAAVCGDPIARLALGDDAPRELDWEDALGTLAPLGREVWLRACCEALRFTFADHEAWSVELEAWLAGFPADPQDLVPEAWDQALLGTHWGQTPLRNLCHVTSLPWPPPQDGHVVVQGRSRADCVAAARSLQEAQGDTRVREDDSGWTLELIASGRTKIALIKEVRALTGFNLRDAKGFVDRASPGSYSAPILATVWRASERAAVLDAVREALRGWALGAAD